MTTIERFEGPAMPVDSYVMHGPDGVVVVNGQQAYIRASVAAVTDATDLDEPVAQQTAATHESDVSA